MGVGIGILLEVDMIDKIQKEIYRFRNEKGVEPNALMLGTDVIKELLATHQLIVEDRTEKNFVCGCEILSIDYGNPKKIKAALI